jgi:hypothetical protein
MLSTLNDLESRVLKVEEDNLELVVPAIEKTNGLVDSLQVAVGRVMADVDQALDEVNDMSQFFKGKRHESNCHLSHQKQHDQISKRNFSKKKFLPPLMKTPT